MVEKGRARVTEAGVARGQADAHGARGQADAHGARVVAKTQGSAGAPRVRALDARQSLVVSVTLFSMFFGAGNLILPPLLGLQAGPDAPAAMAGFLVAGIGLPVLGIIAVALSGTIRELADRVHPLFSRVFVAAVYLAIGPFLAIPRTSSTAFEMLAPLLPEAADVAGAQVAFSVAFFVVAYVLALHPGHLTRLLGRVTGPALVALIVAVTVSSIVAPTGSAAAVQPPYDAAPLAQGFLTGYQTMDLLASLTFGIVIAENIRSLGVTDAAGLTREISKAGLLMAVLMGLIYCGFAYVGLTMGSVLPGATNGAAILTASATMHFGVIGTVVVAAIFLLACLNVCIGLISCCGTYFAETFGAEAPEPHNVPLARVPYRAWAFAFAAFSCFVSNFGLDTILAFSVPLLNALYPVSIVLVIMGMLHRACDRLPQLWVWTVSVTAVASVLVAARDAFLPGLALPLDALPLASIGLGWVFPAVVAAVIGLVHGAIARSRA